MVALSWFVVSTMFAGIIANEAR